MLFFNNLFYQFICCLINPAMTHLMVQIFKANNNDKLNATIFQILVC